MKSYWCASFFAEMYLLLRRRYNGKNLKFYYDFSNVGPHERSSLVQLQRMLLRKASSESQSRRSTVIIYVMIVILRTSFGGNAVWLAKTWCGTWRPKKQGAEKQDPILNVGVILRIPVNVRIVLFRSVIVCGVQRIIRF